MIFPCQLPPWPVPISCCYPGEIPERELHWPSRFCTSHCSLLACPLAPWAAPLTVAWETKPPKWFSESFSLSTQARTSPTRSEIYLKSYLQLISYKHWPFKASCYFLFILWSLLRVSWRLPQKSFAVSGNMQWGTCSFVFIYFSICFPTRLWVPEDNNLKFFIFVPTALNTLLSTQ